MMKRFLLAMVILALVLVPASSLAWMSQLYMLDGVLFYTDAVVAAGAPPEVLEQLWSSYTDAHWEGDLPQDAFLTTGSNFASSDRVHPSISFMGGEHMDGKSVSCIFEHDGEPVDDSTWLVYMSKHLRQNGRLAQMPGLSIQDGMYTLNVTAGDQIELGSLCELVPGSEACSLRYVWSVPHEGFLTTDEPAFYEVKSSDDGKQLLVQHLVSLDGAPLEHVNVHFRLSVSEKAPVQPTVTPSVQPTITPSAPPPTGDNTPVALLCLLMTLSAAGALLLRRRRA